MRARRLIWVGLLLAVLAAGAVVLDWFERNREGPGLVGRTLVGGANLAQAGVVLIETAGGQVTMRRTKWGWTVDEQHGFAADTGKLRALLLLLARTPVGQRVRVEPKRLGDLGLLQKVENEWRFESGRTASVLSVIRGLEGRHRLLYQLLVGNRRPGLGTYVRFPASSAAYLVAEALELDGQAEHWIERRIFDEDAAASMAEIHIRGAGRAPLTVSRAGQQAPWRLAGAQAAARAERVAELPRTLAGLRLTRVGPQAEAREPQAAPAGAAVVEVRFFDRRTVTLTLHPAPGTTPRRAALAARLSEAGGSDDARRRVEVFNRAFAGRLVELDAAQSGRLLRGRPADPAGG